MSTSISWKSIILWLSFAILVIYNAIDGFSDRYLWYDESGQFFISMGLNHFSPPLSSRGTFFDVLVNNTRLNLDPGGFSILLYFWTYISQDVMFLRILPYLFYLAGAIFVFKISRVYINSLSLSVMFTATWFFLPAVSQQAVELRAYSMELFGTIFSVWYCITYKKELNDYSRLFLLSVFMAVFCTSRYGFILVAFAISLWVVYILFKDKKSWKDLLVNLFFYSMPLLMALLFIYQYSLRFQNLSSGFNLWYVDYLNDDIRMFFKPMSLLFYAVVVIALVKRIKKRKLSDFHVITLIVSIVFFVTSILGFYPWDKIRTISAFMLSMLFSILFVMSYAEKRWQIGGKLYLHLLFLALANIFVLTNYHFRFNKDSAGLIEFCEWKRSNIDEKLGLDIYFYPNIKYLFEYGDLKNKKAEWNYPNAYVLCNDEINAQKYLFEDGNKTDSVKEKYLLSANEELVSLPPYTCIKVIKPNGPIRRRQSGF